MANKERKYSSTNPNPFSQMKMELIWDWTLRGIFPKLKFMNIFNLLRELKEEGKITHVGPKKTGHWELSKYI